MDEDSGGGTPPNTNTDKLHFDLNNKYRLTDIGPYSVFVEHKDKNIGRLFPIRIGHFLQKVPEFRNDIMDIKPVGRNRVKVIFKSYNVANTLINHTAITENSLIAYIPQFFTHKKGVVRLVDTYFTEEYLKDAIKSNIEVIEVKRMKRKVIDQNTKDVQYVDRQMIIVTFLGNKIPECIKINMVNFHVEPYVYPVVQCYQCFRFGHTKSQCRSKAKCNNCAQDNCLSDPCTNEKRCVHCGSNDHMSTSRQCPAYNKQQCIKKIMSTQNLSFKESEIIVNNPSYAKITNNNRFSLLANSENFPDLPTSSSNTLFITKPKSRPLTQSMAPKKRKKSLSPPETPTQISENSTQHNSTFTPSTSVPKEDLKSYKETLITKLENFLNDVVKQRVKVREYDVKQIVKEIIEGKESSDKNYSNTILINSDENDEINNGYDGN